MLKNRPHNGHQNVSECDQDSVDEEDFETMECISTNEDGDIQLDESDIIDSNLMKMWSDRAVCID